MITLNHQSLCLQKNLWERDMLVSEYITSYKFPLCYKEADSGMFGQILGRNFNDSLLFRTHSKALLGESEKTEFIIHCLTF